MIRQVEAVYVPAPLARGVRGILEVLVGRFKKTIVQAVHVDFRNKIGSEKNAVGILQKEFARRVGLAAEFRYACTRVHEEVRVGVEQLANVSKILTAFSHVRRHKCGVRMALEHATALRKQFRFLKMSAVESPVRMSRKFLVALIEPINRLK